MQAKSDEALAVHGAVGYTDLGHLVPALGAALTLVVGLALGWPGAPDLGADCGWCRSER